MASNYENTQFNERILSEIPFLLDAAIDWIKKNLYITEVYDDATIKSATINYCRDYLQPDEVFSERDLESWARRNGFEIEK